MKIHELVQGTAEWHAHRQQHFNASDAPAMLGMSPFKTRDQLLKEKHLDMQPDVNAPTQALFDAGHRFEALARPLAEEKIGEALYPVVGSLGKLSASFDGLTFAYDTSFEHKKLNTRLRACIRQDGGSANDFLEAHYRVQMEQQLLISGADKVLFMSSDWDADGNLIEERSCWYTADLQLRQQIIDGWEQFEKDLAVYALPKAAAPAPVAKAPATLPALRIEVTGQVTASNLAEFKETALAAIRSVNRELTTDQQFADAEKAVKWCSDVETRLEAAKNHALSQTASIDALFKTIDDISAEARRVRLDLNKLVTQRKGEVKDEAVDKVRRALNLHLQALNGELAPISLQPIPVDFAGAIKGMRSIDSMNEALSVTLAKAKIEADAQARKLRANLMTFQAKAVGFEFLFSDLHQIVHKADEDLVLLLHARIDKHKSDEAAKEAQRQAEADRRAREKVEAEQRAAAALAAQQAQPPAAPPPVAAPVQAAAVRAPVPAPKADEPATLKLGAICDRLGFTMTSAFVAETLRINPAKVEGASKLYRQSDFARICNALRDHIEQVQMAVPA